jgi:hypothetical protein
MSRRCVMAAKYPQNIDVTKLFVIMAAFKIAQKSDGILRCIKRISTLSTDTYAKKSEKIPELGRAKLSLISSFDVRRNF